MQKLNKKLLIFLTLFVFFIFQINQKSFAVYEVVNAKTVGNENIETNSVEEFVSTYNDPDLPDFSEDGSAACFLERKTRNFFDKLKRKRSGIQNEDTETENLEDAQITSAENKVLSPKKGENEITIDNKNKFQINADKITYDETEGNVYANGNVEIISKEQNVTLKANVAVLDRSNQTIKLYDNVKIIKQGIEMLGEYMLVDLNEQNILMDNPTLEAYSFEIKAQEGYLIANDIQILNGNLKSTKDTQIAFETRGFQRLNNMTYYVKDSNSNKYTDTLDLQEKKQAYKIDAKEVLITSYKDHDSIILKGSNVYYNKHKIMYNTDIEIITDKQRQVIETNSFEFGSIRNFGIYAGYSLVSKLPKGHIFKVAPLLTYGDSNIGVGVLGRYRTQNGMLEAGYNSSTTDLIARGKYNFGRGFALNYGRHAYIPEGFFGARRSGYAAQLQYAKSYAVGDIGAYFSHMASAGIFSDYQKHDQENAYATTRFRYMAQISKVLAGYENKEQDLSVKLYAIAQGAATLYGSGETVGVARFGPTVGTRLKCWQSSIGYYFAGVHGDSPFWFDKYRYGKSSIVLNERFDITNKFAIGYRATISPLKDNYEDDLLTESRLYAIFGPDELKLALSYDFVRDICHLDFMFLLGTKSTRIDFEKLSTKDMDKRNEKQRDFYKRTNTSEEYFDEML